MIFLFICPKEPKFYLIILLFLHIRRLLVQKLEKKDKKNLTFHLFVQRPVRKLLLLLLVERNQFVLVRFK